MNRLMKVFTGTLLAVTVVATSFSAPAHAGKRERAIFTGILLGAVGGAIIAGEIDRANRRKKRQPVYAPPPRKNRVYVAPRQNAFVPQPARRFDHPRRLSRWERHVRRCYRRYRSYDERSDTFIGYDGIERRCRL